MRLLIELVTSENQCDGCPPEVVAGRESLEGLVNALKLDPCNGVLRNFEQ